MKLLILSFLISTLSYANDCTYSFDSSSAKIEATGFKFTEKTGVTGTFKDSQIKAPATAKSLEEILKKATFSLTESTLDFGNPARNSNILKGLFKNIEGETISGNVKSVNPAKQTLVAVLKWGGKNHDVTFNYTYKDGMFEAKSNIDIVKLGFGKAFKGLQKFCSANHKGSDGKIKSWSDVDLKASAKIEQSCS